MVCDDKIHKIRFLLAVVDDLEEITDKLYDKMKQHKDSKGNWKKKPSKDLEDAEMIFHCAHIMQEYYENKLRKL
jgi:hypothetical protein